MPMTPADRWPLDPGGVFMRWGVAMSNIISRLRASGLYTLLALTLLATPAFAEPLQPQAVIESFYRTLLDVMKQGGALGFSGRYSHLKPAIEQAFNLPLMSRLSIGPQWQTFNPELQQKLTEAFSDFTISTYANRFDGYSGEHLEVLPQTTQAGGGTIVQTRLIKSDGEPVTLNYLMRETNGSWQIVDVFLSGTISELATRRSEFTSVLRRDGAQGLLDLLERRIADLRTS
jgi:phospholipid transport system substrate-binding protein